MAQYIYQDSKLLVLVLVLVVIFGFGFGFAMPFDTFGMEAEFRFCDHD